MGLKITVCISSWGQFWTKDTKRREKKKTKTKKTTSTSEELRAETGYWEQSQGILRSPCTQHHLRSEKNT